MSRRYCENFCNQVNNFALELMAHARNLPDSNSISEKKDLLLLSRDGYQAAKTRIGSIKNIYNYLTMLIKRLQNQVLL